MVPEDPIPCPANLVHATQLYLDLRLIEQRIYDSGLLVMGEYPVSFGMRRTNSLEPGGVKHLQEGIMETMSSFDSNFGSDALSITCCDLE